MRVFLSLGLGLVACNCPKYKAPEPTPYTVTYVECPPTPFADASLAIADAADDAEVSDAGDASSPPTQCYATCAAACAAHPPGLGVVGPTSCTSSAPGDAGETIAQCVQQPGPSDPPACF